MQLECYNRNWKYKDVCIPCPYYGECFRYAKSRNSIAIVGEKVVWEYHGNVYSLERLESTLDV